MRRTLKRLATFFGFAFMAAGIYFSAEMSLQEWIASDHHRNLAMFVKTYSEYREKSIISGSVFRSPSACVWITDELIADAETHLSANIHINLLSQKAFRAEAHRYMPDTEKLVRLEEVSVSAQQDASLYAIVVALTKNRRKQQFCGPVVRGLWL